MELFDLSPPLICRKRFIKYRPYKVKETIMGDVAEKIGKAFTAPFEFIGNLVSDPGHIGDHLQNFGSSMTGGLIPPKEKDGEKGEKPMSEEEQKAKFDEEWKQGQIEANEILTHMGYSPISFDGGSSPSGNPPAAPNTPNAPGQGSTYTITVTSPPLTTLR